MQEALLSPLATWQNFYRHRRHRCGDTDGLDVHSHHLDRADTGAGVVTQERDCGLQYPQRRAFWRRAAGRSAAQRTLAGALEC